MTLLVRVPSYFTKLSYQVLLFGGVDLVLNYHFLRKTNEKIVKMNLPALHPIDAFKLREHVEESVESQVLLINLIMGNYLS